MTFKISDTFTVENDDADQAFSMPIDQLGAVRAFLDASEIMHSVVYENGVTVAMPGAGYRKAVARFRL